MPIPVGRSGNVDGEGGTPDSAVRSGSVAGSGGLAGVRIGPGLRIGMESSRIQRIRALRGAWTARALGLDVSGEGLRTAVMELGPRLEELTDDADDYGTDGS